MRIVGAHRRSRSSHRSRSRHALGSAGGPLLDKRHTREGKRDGQ